MKKLSLLILTTVFAFASYSQGTDYGQIHGNMETNVQYYKEDSLIGATKVSEKMLMNGFANINYTKGNFSAGFRYETYLNALQGFPVGYTGSGIGYRFARYKLDGIDVTAGHFYEQFGSGMILRSYEERALGYDNALDGFRVKYSPHKAVELKGIYGKQRLYFGLGEGIVRGIDGEVALNDLSDSIQWKTRVILGGSFVSKYQKDNSQILNLPENVGSYAGRISIYHGDFSFSGEYVEKINDPSRDNGMIYKKGQALLLNSSYSQKGLGISFTAKTIDNMSFRSDRDAGLTDLMINYLPSTSKQHTYNLPATLYPYAVQPNGEVAFEGTVSYKLKKKRKYKDGESKILKALGGKYGMDIAVDWSGAWGLDSTAITDSSKMGYSTKFFSPGKDLYFSDFNIEINKKINKNLKFIYTYYNIRFNNDVILGKTNTGIVNASIHVIDVLYKMKNKHSIRIEAQHLNTNKKSHFYKDQGNWATGLVEYTISPKWVFSVLDQYNYGNKVEEKRIHYFFGTVGYIKGTNRFTLSYGRLRAGTLCVGGVCRVVPASNGVSFSITSSF